MSMVWCWQWELGGLLRVSREVFSCRKDGPVPWARCAATVASECTCIEVILLARCRLWSFLSIHHTFARKIVMSCGYSVCWPNRSTHVDFVKPKFCSCSIVVRVVISIFDVVVQSFYRLFDERSSLGNPSSAS
jgi:hypothetical protein